MTKTSSSIWPYVSGTEFRKTLACKDIIRITSLQEWSGYDLVPTFCRLVGFSWVLSMIFIATWKDKVKKSSKCSWHIDLTSKLHIKEAITWKIMLTVHTSVGWWHNCFRSKCEKAGWAYVEFFLYFYMSSDSKTMAQESAIMCKAILWLLLD